MIEKTGITGVKPNMLKTLVMYSLGPCLNGKSKVPRGKFSTLLTFGNVLLLVIGSDLQGLDLRSVG